MASPNITAQINKINLQLEELEKSQMFVKQTLPIYEDNTFGYTTPKSKKSTNSQNWSDQTTSPSGEDTSNYQQSIFNAPQKDFEFPEYMYESPKNTTSLKFKFMNNTYTYFDNEEVEQQNKQKQKQKEETKKKTSHDFFQNYFKKKEPDQNDLRVILGLPVFDKED